MSGAHPSECLRCNAIVAINKVNIEISNVFDEGDDDDEEDDEKDDEEDDEEDDDDRNKWILADGFALNGRQKLWRWFQVNRVERVLNFSMEIRS